MTDKIKYTRESILSYTSSEIRDLNPILYKGEFLYETDTNKVKVGDGVSQYNDLEYVFDVSTQTRLGGLKSGVLGDLGSIFIDSDGNAIVEYVDRSNKWNTPRTINVNGDAVGSVGIDGSEDVTLTLDIPELEDKADKVDTYTRAEIDQIIRDLNNERILNKGVIYSTYDNIQSTCTSYIETEYGRDPKYLDALIITITDQDNDKIKFTYSNVSNSWVDLGKTEIQLSDASTTTKGVMYLYDSTGSNESGTMTQKAITEFVNDHTSKTNNPHSVTKEQLGLGNVDNTSDKNKPISAATQNALDLKADLALFNQHSNNISNPHKVNKDQVGLGNVDNTSDLNKPISKATQSALNLKANTTDVNQHINNSSNPHNVTKSQVGLSNVDNTSDLNKPISNAVQAALDNKSDTTALLGHTSNINNPHSVTKAQVGLGNVDNTSDEQKPVSKPTRDALTMKADVEDLTKHVTNINNPHEVTKSQVGLGNVDNTSDTDKPISRATQIALDAKADDTDLAPFTEHVNDVTSNPHNVTKSQVGLGNVDNTSDMDKPISKAVQDALDQKATSGQMHDHLINYDNPHKVTKTQVGLGNVDNTSDMDKPISTAMQKGLDNKISKIGSVTVGNLPSITSDGELVDSGLNVDNVFKISEDDTADTLVINCSLTVVPDSLVIKCLLTV